MNTGIATATVLGAGVMGQGIAAHLASRGVRTFLLDIVPPDLDENDTNPEARNRFAAGGLANALKAKPALFVDKGGANLIEVGNFDDDMGRVAESDWVIEVVKEDMAIKRDLLAKVEANWKPGTLVTSNTSGLSIAGMLEGRSDDFKKHFFGTHFFNPVRYMHLVEIIDGPDTDAAQRDRAVTFIRDVLGKGIVFAKDTPNFIANRIGVYAMMRTIGSMTELEYTIEEVDAIVGKPMGRPRSAAFKTADMVGLDTFVHVAQNCYDSLTDDPQRDTFVIPQFLRGMVDKGYLGRKAKAGFYKKEGKAVKTIDIATLEYRDKQQPDLPALKKVKKIEDATKRLKALIESDGRAGKFAWHVLAGTLAYAANIAWEIADDIVNIDRAMRWGFNWEQGPFECWDALGIKEIAERMRADGLSLPAWVDEAIEAGGFYEDAAEGPMFFVPEKGLEPLPQIPGSLTLKTFKDRGGIVEKNRSATLIDIGDGILCCEYHTKMNTIDADLATMLSKGCDIVESGKFDGLLLANEAEHFSAGANLMFVAMMAKQGKLDELEGFVGQVQDLMQRLKYLPAPVVACPHGLTLGGGMEMSMAADRMMVAQETYMGQVEVGVGLIPGACGTLNLLKRMLLGVPKDSTADRLPFIQRAFEAIGLAKIATGGGEVFEFGFGTPQDELAINRDKRIAHGKRLCRYLADRDYVPPKPADNLVLPGKSGAAAISLFVYGMQLSGWASEHDKLIADKVAYVLCGGDTDGRRAVSEQEILDLEREAFMSLLGEDKTMARIEHMLTTNKPLRN